MKIYLTKNDKKRIDTYCKVKVRNGEKIRIKTLGIMLEDKYCLHEIVQYIRECLKIDNKYIWRGNSTDYIRTLPRGHIQFTNMDLYFPNLYLHQYVVHKELNIPIEQLGKYIIHHIDQNKGNNNINNLWVFYDTACHIAYHQAVKHNPNIDIKQFTMNYVESIITDKNATEIKDYLNILDRLERSKKEKILSMPLDKILG